MPVVSVDYDVMCHTHVSIDKGGLGLPCAPGQGTAVRLCSVSVSGGPILWKVLVWLLSPRSLSPPTPPLLRRPLSRPLPAYLNVGT